MSPRRRWDAIRLHVRQELPRDLSKDMLRERVLRSCPEVTEFAEGDELHHVSRGYLTSEGRSEALSVTVEAFHGREISVPNAHNNDR